MGGLFFVSIASLNGVTKRDVGLHNNDDVFSFYL